MVHLEPSKSETSERTKTTNGVGLDFHVICGLVEDKRVDQNRLASK